MVTELTEVVCGVTTDGNHPRYRSVGTVQNQSEFFFFHFPFVEIYRRLLFFTLGRSVSAWIDYSTTTWKWNVLLVGPARCFFLFLPTLLRKLYGDGCFTELPEKFRVRPRYDYEKKHVSRDSKMCCCCCRFCCGAPKTDERIHAPVLHDASQIDYCRYWGRASLPPITTIIIRLKWYYNPPVNHIV